MRARPQTQLGLRDGLEAQLPGNEFPERLEGLVDWAPFRRELEKDYAVSPIKSTKVRRAPPGEGQGDAVMDGLASGAVCLDGPH